MCLNICTKLPNDRNILPSLIQKSNIFFLLNAMSREGDFGNIKMNTPVSKQTERR